VKCRRVPEGGCGDVTPPAARAGNTQRHEYLTEFGEETFDFSAEKDSAAMNEPNQPAQPRPERVQTKLHCLVRMKGRMVRRMTIDDMSKNGLLLRGEGGLYLGVRKGDALVVNTELDGLKLRLEGIVVRSSSGAQQVIALGEVHWYQGWT
jgi:hypothetical protein